MHLMGMVLVVLKVHVVVYGITHTKEEEDCETQSVQSFLLGVKRCRWCTSFWELGVEVHQGCQTFPRTSRQVGGCRDFGGNKPHELAANESGQHDEVN